MIKELRTHATVLALALLAGACSQKTVLCYIQAPQRAVQTDDFQVFYQVLGTSLHVSVDEHDAVSGEWESLEYVEQLHLELPVVLAHGDRQFYVAGRTAAGQDVIELWTRPAATPVNEDDARPFERERLFEGDLGGIGVPSRWFSGLGPLAVDPAERYLLFAAGTPRTLYRLDLETRGASPTVLLDTERAPRLAECNRLELVQVESEPDGRVAIAYYWDELHDRTRWRVVLNDTDDDGVFDSHKELTERKFKASPYAYEHWKHDAR